MPVSTIFSHSPADMDAAFSRQTKRTQNIRSHPRRISNVTAGIKSINSGGRRNSCPALYSTSDDAPVDSSQRSDEAAASLSLIHINDFERQYRRDSMESLLECAGDRREKLTQLLQNTPSLLVKSHLEHIANAHFLARQLEPSAEQSASLDKIMHDLTDMMLKDKLGENSVFGGYRPEQKAACVRRRGLEDKLALLVNTLQGEDGAKPGERFIYEKIRPFVVDYIVQETGRGHDAVKTNHIEQLVEKNAYQCFQNIRSGIQTYQAPSLEKIFRDMDMILILPNLLANLVSRKDAPSRLNTGPTSSAEPMTEATGQDDRTDGADKTGDTQNNRTTPAHAPGVKFNIKYAPKITIDASVKINWPPGTEKKNVDTTQPAGLRDDLQDIFEQLKQARNTETHAKTGSPSRLAKTHLPAGQGLENAGAGVNAEIVISQVTPRAQEQDIHYQPVLPGLGKNIHHQPAQSAATTRARADALTRQRRKQTFFTGTTTQAPLNGTLRHIPTAREETQFSKPNILISAAKQVAEALGDLLRSIPTPASPLNTNHARDHGRPGDGAIANVSTATKTGAPQNGTTEAAHTGLEVPRSLESPARELTGDILRAAREKLKATPARSAHSPGIDSVAAYLVEARNKLKALPPQSATATGLAPAAKEQVDMTSHTHNVRLSLSPTKKTTARENARTESVPRPVILTSQGALRSTHFTSAPNVIHFAPSNLPPVNLGDARDGLSRTGYMPPLRQARINAGPAPAPLAPATAPISNSKKATDGE